MWADGVGRRVDVMDRVVECRTVSENLPLNSSRSSCWTTICRFLSHPPSFLGLTEVWDNIPSLKVKTFFYMCVGNVKIYILNECVEVPENTTDIMGYNKSKVQKAPRRLI